MKPKISVLMSTYKNDNPEYISIAIDSMLQQTLKPDEIIIVADGPLPRDNYLLLEKYRKKHNEIKLIRLKNNVGLGLALKAGLEKCKNDIVARMDSDDISEPDRLEKEYKALVRQQVDIVGSNIAEFIDSPNNVISRRIVPEKDIDIKKYLKTRCPMNHVTVLFYKTAVTECGGYEDFKFNEDYILWIKMFENNKKFYNIQEDLVKVRIGKDMFKRRGGRAYCSSELAIQKYLHNHNIINTRLYLLNSIKRITMQIILPNKIREIVYKTIARGRI